MNRQDIFSIVDHTLLKQTATFEQIKQLCDEAIEFGAASVCIPPCYVKRASEYVQGKMTVCTVIGFPNGNMTTASKVFETRDAIANGATEIDMVINIGELKAGNTDYVLDEIRQIKQATGKLVLKVIIETCLLTEEEKITCGAQCENQGCGRHLLFCGCGKIHRPGRQPFGHQPHHQACLAGKERLSIVPVRRMI